MFTVSPLEVMTVPQGRLVLQTLRSHDQFNTTIYGLDDRYRGVYGGRRVVFITAADLAELGFADGDLVDLVSSATTARAAGRRFRLVAYDTPRGCVAAYYPETNPLVPLDSTPRAANTRRPSGSSYGRSRPARTAGRRTGRTPPPPAAGGRRPMSRRTTWADHPSPPFPLR